MNEYETVWWELPSSTSCNELKNNTKIQQAASLLKNGELVAFPTETVYGLGADATSEEAVRSIFIAKGRPQDNPLILHIGEKKQLFQYARDVSFKAMQLVDHFWPGPLTLICKGKENIASSVTAGLPTVGIRMPSHPIALALLQCAHRPIAAPSANTSGRPSPTEAKHVWEDLEGKIAALLDGGRTGMGVESTIIDMTKEIPIILRPGGITQEEVETVIGKVEVAHAHQWGDSKPIAPGMKYTHYAPRGELWLVKGEQKEVTAYVRRKAEALQKEGQRVGILTTEESVHRYNADVVLSCGRKENPLSVAQELYRTLRRFDEYRVDIILSEAFVGEGLFFSVMNRLEKAAGGRIVHV